MVEKKHGKRKYKEGKYFNKKLKTIPTQIPYSKLNLSQNLNAIQYIPIQITRPKSYLNPNLRGLTVFSNFLSPFSMQNLFV